MDEGKEKYIKKLGRIDDESATSSNDEFNWEPDYEDKKIKPAP